MANNFTTRAITSLILLILFVFLYSLKLNYLFLILIFGIVYYELFNNKIINLYFIFLLFLIYLFILYFIDNIFILALKYRIPLFSIFVIITLISFMNLNILLSKIFFNVFTFLCFVFFTLLYIDNYNIFFIIIFFTSINDILAYIIGSYFKGPKIIPSISPNKTWSGTLSSYFISVALLFYLFDFAIVYNLLLPITFFIGDIYYSNFKRIINIKDYGSLIKGHGGVLDRLDSSFLSLSFSFLLFLFI